MKNIRGSKQHRNNSFGYPAMENINFPIENTSSIDGFSIAMLVYQRVDPLNSFHQRFSRNWARLCHMHPTPKVYLLIEPCPAREQQSPYTRSFSKKSRNLKGPKLQQKGVEPKIGVVKPPNHPIFNRVFQF